MSARAKLAYAALTDVGRVRAHNEDSVLAQPPLFVVADGLGGHEAGEVASAIAVETLRDHAPRRADGKSLARAVRAANREVIRAAREGVGRAGMGTTMTAVIVEGTRLAVAHVGDSRAYLLHAKHLERLTEDHSMVADMIRRGQLTETAARYHPNRSVITRALGSDPNMVADSFEVDAAPGDRLLLCSDGLTSMLEDAAIEGVLGEYRDPSVAAEMLVQAANEAGGHDNISVLVIDLEGEQRETEVAERRRIPRGLLGALGWLVAFALVVGSIGYGVYRHAQTRAYLIAENGVVAIYRGVPGSFAGVRLSWPAEKTDIAVDALPVWRQDALRDGLAVNSLARARAVADDLRSDAASRTPGITPVK